MKKVFVSGYYDILHAGHIQFFEEAKALGNHLTVCIASDKVLWAQKNRMPSIPFEHKQVIIQSLKIVDDVVMGDNMELGLDFKDHFLRIMPDILAVTEDDKYPEKKQSLCKEHNVEYRMLPKTSPKFKPISTTGIVKWIRAPKEAPLRVDFAGGWLDVPRFARDGGFIVNCAISPLVSINAWNYKQRSGLGGSGAWAILNGRDGVLSELDLGVGWQDPAVIQETGLCVWRSGQHPVLEIKRNGDMLRGLMALYYTNEEHDTPGIVKKDRDFDSIFQAGQVAAQAIFEEDVNKLGQAIQMSYQVQMNEGMEPLIESDNCLARKYCGGGWGGYAVYLFSDTEHRDIFVSEHSTAMAIEPYIKPL